MLKAILISSLAIPIIVLTLFVITGLIFFMSELISNGKYSNSWLGLLYAGAVYSYFSVLISSIPTVALGLPASLIAKKYGYLKKSYIITGATLLGGFFLGVASALLFKIVTVQSLFWFVLAGSIGGLINGFVFLKNMKHNNQIKPALKSNAAY
jgi:hypothetical protein